MTKASTKLSTRCYKGAKDLYPVDKQIHNYICQIWRQTAQQFGFLEYGAPILEPLEIYQAKSGDEIANQQTYAFTDRGGRQVAIRPEMTPTISRLVAAKRQELAYPARLYSIANFMRYERPQKGREREFWQLNSDIFGDDSVFADAEIIIMSWQILMNFGATEDMFKIYINDRRLINHITKVYLELSDENGRKLIRLLDQKNKISEQAFKTNAAELLEADTVKINKLMALIANPNIKDLPAEFKATEDYQRIIHLLDILKKQGINNAEFDILLMRGLDYYTGTVFEFFDNHPDNNRSLFGGGRYDGLVAMFGAEPISAVGVAPGASTCLEFIKLHDLCPVYKPTTSFLIIPIDDQEQAAMSLAQQLRNEGINIEIDFTNRKIAKKIQSANKKKMTDIIIIGKNESDKGIFTYKNLANGDNIEVDLRELKKILTD